MMILVLTSLGLIAFFLGYHMVDLAFNSKFSECVEVGNGLSIVGLHMDGIRNMFIGVSCFIIAMLFGLSLGNDIEKLKNVKAKH